MKGMIRHVRPMTLPVVVLTCLIIPFIFLYKMPAPEARLASFTTRLAGRTSGQRHNAVRSARLLDGAILPPHGTFSFNQRVRGWEPERGFVRAPVSYDGALIPAFGGGVCQTSTTLYNAALLAGLSVVERHPHAYAPRYVAPGQDAAVAYPGIDLRLVNPYPFPVRLAARADSDQLTIEIRGKRDAATLKTEYTLIADVLAQDDPPPRREPMPPLNRLALRPKSMTGFHVITYRAARRAGKEIRRERLSEDSYPALPVVLRVARSDD